MIGTNSSKSQVAEAVREALRAVKYPGYSRDIVSFGMLKEVCLRNGTVLVSLAVNSAKPEAAFQIKAESEKVLKALPALHGLEIDLEVTSPSGEGLPDSDAALSRLNSRQAAAPESPVPFDPDPMIAAMMRPDLAPGVGYGEDGPDPLGGPTGDRTTTKWQGQVPVFQWEIDPSDSSGRQYGEHEVERGGWMFRLWWQVHPADLVFASISAIGDENDEVRPFARQHPIGRNVAVNLVYDLRRQGVVAVYGTALDFRPFVEVFLEAFNSQKLDPASATSPVKENKS
jgi:metal-sulfur cluster biosynthetic enzyme